MTVIELVDVSSLTKNLKVVELVKSRIGFNGLVERMETIRPILEVLLATAEILCAVFKVVNPVAAIPVPAVFDKAGLPLI